jgi:hypothetical protein
MSDSSTSIGLEFGQVVPAICGAGDFLPLDGSVISQADYPDLYQAMKSSGQLLPPPQTITATTGNITNPVKVVWNEAFYCAINAFGACETSSDGQTWMAGTMPAHPFTDMVWSPELGTFCAIASDGVACTSQDGHSWTAHTISSAVTAFQAITWTGTTFVAVGTNNLVVISTDGAAWACPNPPLNVWNSVVWNGTQFCAVGGSATYPSTSVALSSDGLSWSGAKLPAATAWKFLVWTGSRYVDLNAVGTISATSADGVTWVQHPVPNLTWTGLCVSGANVVAANTERYVLLHN